MRFKVRDWVYTEYDFYSSFGVKPYKAYRIVTKRKLCTGDFTFAIKASDTQTLHMSLVGFHLVKSRLGLGDPIFLSHLLANMD